MFPCLDLNGGSVSATGLTSPSPGSGRMLTLASSCFVLPYDLRTSVSSSSPGQVLCRGHGSPLQVAQGKSRVLEIPAAQQYRTQGRPFQRMLHVFSFSLLSAMLRLGVVGREPAFPVPTFGGKISLENIRNVFGGLVDRGIHLLLGCILTDLILMPLPGLRMGCCHAGAKC